MADDDQTPEEPTQLVQLELRQLTVRIDSTGRLVMLAVPADLTDAEILEFMAWMANPGGMRLMLRPPSPIVVARSIPQIPLAD